MKYTKDNLMLLPYEVKTTCSARQMHEKFTFDTGSCVLEGEAGDWIIYDGETYCVAEEFNGEFSGMCTVGDGDIKEFWGVGGMIARAELENSVWRIYNKHGEQIDSKEADGYEDIWMSQVFRDIWMQEWFDSLPNYVPMQYKKVAVNKHGKTHAIDTLEKQMLRKK